MTGEELKEYQKAYYEAHREEIKEYKKDLDASNKESQNAYKKAYYKVDVNSNGEPKLSIRVKSNAILNKTGYKRPGYEIHHCFGYEDPNKFIYISKALHLKIHRLLRDNNIDADSEHWMTIRDIVNDTDEFIYIRD